MKPRQLISRDWLDLLTDGPIGIGLDLATTEKKTSNPSSLTLSQTDGRIVFERLIVRFKTGDDRVTKEVLRVVCEDLRSVKKKARGIAVDASSEKFLCAQISREFTKYAPVRLIASGEAIVWKGEALNYKQLLGNLYSSLFEDALIGLPEGEWIMEDHRLVLREKGSFMANLGPNGEHGDTFDSGKLANWCLVRGGRAEISAASITGGSAGRATAALRNPLAKKFGVSLTKAGGSGAAPGSGLRTRQPSRRSNS
jgi:hypothetical protein